MDITQPTDQRPDGDRMPVDPWHGRTVPALVSANAARQPDAVALIHRREQITYRELDDLSDGYAAALHRAGVRAGDFVPIRLPRSVPLVAIALGVLKLGAAYALMDGGWPAERVRDEVDQLAAPLLVAATVDAVPGLPVPVWVPPAVQPTAPTGYPRAEGHGTDPHAVFFTSGTTGRPKGAVSPHSGVIRLFDDEAVTDFGPGAVVPNAAAQPWDLFSFELWGPLLSGGTVVLIDEPFLTGALIRELVVETGVTHLFATTSLFNMLVDEDPTCFRGLTAVLAGGERLSPPHCRAFLTAHPQISLINGYGPVEATVFATSWLIGPADCELPGGVPIGRPVPWTGIHLLDGDRACAVGEVGEICVSGAGLCSGYLADPELTARKFVTLTLPEGPTRVYRTGDLGLRDADGVVHYRGRADRQLKVRGFRVEPVEVEAAISALPGVRTVVVLPRRDPSGSCLGMLAFYLATPDAPEPAVLHALLRDRIAAYQIPDRLIPVDALPLLPNGKLDGDHLLRLATESAPASGPVDAGTDEDPVTAMVRAIVAGVVGVPPESVPDDAAFAAIGAVSLDLGRIASRVGDRTGRPVPLSQLFGNPTVAGLAGWLRAAAEIAPATRTDAADPGASAPMSALQTLMAAEHATNPANLDLHCVYVWRVAGRPDRKALRAAFGYLHERHAALRSGYDLAAGTAVVPTDRPAPAMLESLVRTEVEAVDQLTRDLSRPFTLHSADVWRPVFVAVRDAPVTFIGLSAHHVAVDGGSAPTLAADFAHAYQAFRAGTAPHQPAAPTVAEIAAARDAHLAYVDLPAQREMWRRTLTGTPELRFPPSEPAEQPIGMLRVPLDHGFRAVAEETAARLGVSPFVVYLTAYAQTLSALTGQTDFGIGTSVNRRGTATLHRSVSCLVGILCLRPGVAADTAPEVAVKQVAGVVSAAFAAQDIPIYECVELAGAAGGDRQALFQNMFLLQDNADADMTLDGLAARFYRPPYPGVPSELVTELWPTPDGAVDLLIGYRTAAVPAAFCADLAAGWTARVRSYGAGATEPAS